jgi:hypothetical protein
MKQLTLSQAIEGFLLEKQAQHLRDHGDEDPSQFRMTIGHQPRTSRISARISVVLAAIAS